MRGEFLSGEQERRYGRYAGGPSQAQLDRYFHLDAADRELVEARRGEHNRLGFAVQLGTVRFLGTFLPDPTDVPELVVAYVAAQLGVEDPGVLKGYAQRQATQWEHAGEIQRAYGYRDFSDPDVQADLAGWLAARVRTTADRTSVLFDLATARLVEAKVLLPGPSLLERLAATAREQAAQQLHAELAGLPDEQQRGQLAGLLVVDEATRTSRLERLRRGPTSVTAAGLLGALDRLVEVRRLGVGTLDLSGVPAGRVATLARHAQAARAQALARMAEPRRTATCSPPPGSWRPTPPTTCSTCSTGCWPGCWPAASASSSGNGCARCPPSTSPPARCAMPSPCCSTRPRAGPAGYRQCGRHWSNAACPAPSSPTRWTRSVSYPDSRSRGSSSC